MKKPLSLFFIALLGVSISIAQNSRPQRIKNIILMIGDGMGLSQVSAGYYSKKGPFQLERCRHIGLVKTHSAVDLITDSAAGATAMSCGHKTYNGVLAMDIEGEDLKTILESAHEQGLSTGLIATSTIQHATPAAFYAHNMSRTQYEDISLGLLSGNIDFLVGGGRRLLNDRKDQRDLVLELEQQGVGVCKNLRAAKKLANDKVFVITDNGHLPPARKRAKDFLGNAALSAIEHLGKNSQGFFLMLESSQIDWGGHSNDGTHIIEEMVDFDSAIGKVLDFAERDGETLVIITADHETGGFSIENGDLKAKTIETDFTTDGHSATMVPVFAFGPGAEEFMGIIDNTDIYYKMMRALQLHQ